MLLFFLWPYKCEIDVGQDRRRKGIDIPHLAIQQQLFLRFETIGESE